MVDWGDRFLSLAAHVAEWSKDPSTKVGAVIVERDRFVIGMGYNGFPRGIDDAHDRYLNKDLKYKMVVHAEANAILNAVKSVRGCTLYATFFPCPGCAALIIQSGISKVITGHHESDERYAESRALSMQMFGEAGVVYGYGK